MEKANNKRDNSENVICNHIEYKRDQRHYYRNLILSSVSSFFLGAILKAFLNTLGFGVFLFGLLLCLFGGVLAKCL